jgi:hypothetical protein
MPEPQSWDELFHDLEALDWKTELQTASGTLYVAQEGYEFIWQGQEWYFEEVPDDIVSDELLNFLWDTAPGLSWGESIQLMQKEPATAYVGYYVEDGDLDPTNFLAKITPGDAAPIYQEIVSRILHGDYTYEPWVRLPDTIVNRRPDLIDQATVRAALRVQLERASELRGSVWAELAETVNVADVAEDDADVEEAVKEGLLDKYFERCYSEQNA